MLSRKYYQMIAYAIATARNMSNQDIAIQVLERVVSELAIQLKADNPRFDEQRFIKWCNK